MTFSSIKHVGPTIKLMSHFCNIAPGELYSLKNNLIIPSEVYVDWKNKVVYHQSEQVSQYCVRVGDGDRCSVEGVKWIWASRCRCGLRRNTAEKRRGQAWEFVPRFPFFLCRQTHNMAD